MPLRDPAHEVRIRNWRAVSDMPMAARRSSRTEGRSDPTPVPREAHTVLIPGAPFALIDGRFNIVGGGCNTDVVDMGVRDVALRILHLETAASASLTDACIDIISSTKQHRSDTWLHAISRFLVANIGSAAADDGNNGSRNSR